MEKITTYNYEAYYLDYLEGHLDDSGKNRLFTFLDTHPVLKAELELDGDILDFTLNSEKDSLTKFEKEDLKQFDCKVNEICFNNVNDYIIADVENEITSEKKLELSQFISEHDLQITQDYFNVTKLKADLTEVYPDKTELKKKGTIIPLFVKIASVAAVGLLVFNLVNSSSNSIELYSPRQGEFALQIDSLNHTFDVNLNVESAQPDNYVFIENPIQSNDVVIAHENQPVDTLTTPFINLDPVIDIVEEKEETNDHPIMPLHEDDNDEIVMSNSSENISKEIKLVDMYKPITNLTNSYTDLDVSYQKSIPESDYAVTVLSIGKFSFERKKRL